MQRFWPLVCLVVFTGSLVGTSAAAGLDEEGRVPSLASLSAATGLWDMPSARILPDWNVRIKYGRAEPYRYYGVALGLFNRLEVHGQFTEVSTLLGFPGYEYGYYKDRSAGVRLVLWREREWLPQLAVGAYDPIGTLLFPSRYLVASKRWRNLDLTLGLGQGILGGQGYKEIQAERPGGKAPETFDTTFLFSSPLRPTRVFGGVEYHASPRLTFSLEYSSLEYERLFGAPDKAAVPINLGFKYRPWPHITLQGGWMRGQEIALGLAADMPLSPEGLLVWRKEKPYRSEERTRWRAEEADDRGLARLVGEKIQEDGFAGVAVAVRDDALWIEAGNSRYLSDAKALGRLAAIADEICPSRITTLYVNLTRRGQVSQSLKARRETLRAFRQSRLDKKGFLAFAELTDGTLHYQEFFDRPSRPERIVVKDPWYAFSLNPRLRTFLNNRRGFFKFKALLAPRLKIYPWSGATLHAGVEIPLYNEWDTVDYGAYEPKPARTDLLDFERHSITRLAILALEQYLSLPGRVQARVAAGYFENAYAGIGGELFRFLQDGRFGIGVEGAVVRKRDPEDSFRLHPQITAPYYTAFVNLYAQIWPALGLEGGLKIGRFLGGDLGARLELRRSYRYFTIGGWYTATDTDVFVSAKNRGVAEKGVYIRIPFSIFTDRDVRGHLRYEFTSFTRDQGTVVSQPSRLYPLDNFSTLDHTRRHLEDMRQ